MAEVNQERLDLFDLIGFLKENSNNAKILVLDTEASLRSGRSAIIFDFAYGVVNSDNLEWKENNIVNNLVYEAISDPELLASIRSWGKVNNAVKGSLYNFYRELQLEEWDIHKNIERTGLKVAQLLQLISVSEAKFLKADHQAKMKDYRKSMVYWHALRDPSSIKSKTEKRRKLRSAKRYATAQSINSMLDTIVREEDLMFSKNTESADSQLLRGYKQTLLHNLYKEHNQNRITEIKKLKLEELKQKIGKNNVQHWDTILDDFIETIEKKKVLAVTGYNISQDRSYIFQSNNYFNSRYKGQDIFESKKITTTCMYNMYKALINDMDVEKTYKILTEKNVNATRKVLEAAVKKKIKSSKGTLTFQAAYKATFEKEQSYKQLHTAKQDVFDEGKVLAEWLEKAWDLV